MVLLVRSPTRDVPDAPAPRTSGRRAAFLPLIAVLPLWAATLALVHARWSPIGDEALIAGRSWDILHGHGVLVGETTQAGVSLHAPVFDPGPLLYWILTIPTTLLPNVGPALAVALFSSICVVVAIAAAGRTYGRAAAWSVAATAVVLEWSLTEQLAVVPIWNCYVPLLPFLALLCLSWVVAGGRLWWWPFSVVLGSFATQSHMMYALPSLLLVLGAPVLWSVGHGLPIRDRRSLRAAGMPLTSGLLVGLLCWLAPLIEQVRSSPGNLHLLWDSTVGSSDTTLGLSTAVRRFGQAVYPLDPLWLRAPHPSGFQLSELSGHTTFAVAALLGLIAIAVLCRRSRPALSTLAAVTVLADVAGIYTVAHISLQVRVTIDYIQLIYWPLGIATSSALLWGTWRAARWAVARRSGGGQEAVRRAWPRWESRSTRLAATGVLALAAIVLAGWQAARVPAYATLTAHGNRRQIIQVATSIAHQVGSPRARESRVLVDVPPFVGYDSLIAQEAISYQLRIRGWTPTSDNPIIRNLTAPVYTARATDQHLQFGVWDGPAPDTAVVRRGSVSVPGSTTVVRFQLVAPAAH